ncbi:MAG: undecaprenyl diphosphate synthase family protein [Acidimicrobiia bacterium]
MFTRRASVRSASEVGGELRHAVVVGGELSEWESMSESEWERRVALIGSVASRHGARHLSVLPYGATGGSSMRGSVRHESHGVSVVVSWSADGRERIAAAVRTIDPARAIDEQAVEKAMHGEAGEPDLVVVLGPSDRLPPSLVWELAYSELVFVDTSWDSLDAEALDDALGVFHGRERRFGGVDG